MARQRVMLYFGSFDPIHNGHTALAEWVVERDLCDMAVLVVSPQNPHKRDLRQTPEFDRFSMAELACAASRHPDRIKPSAVEFLLPRPSYTIDTLRYLSGEFGDGMEFSILMGGDLVEKFDTWKEAGTLRRDYPIYVYPRRGYDVSRLGDGMTYLSDAPMCDFSSTEVRHTIETGGDASRMVAPAVLGYIREKKLWNPERYFDSLSERLAAEPDDTECLLERGRWHYRRNEWGKALNDFNRVTELAPDCVEAQQMREMIYEILQFRYTDIYNP